MGVINTGSFAAGLIPGLKGWFGIGYNEHSPEFSDTFKKDTSDKAYVEIPGFSGLGLATEKSQGGSISFDSFRQYLTNRFTNVTYGLGFIITREMVEDSQYAEIGKQRSRSLAFSMRQTKENVGAAILNRGWDTGYLGADGVELFSIAHLTDGSTFANELATAADLSSASLEQACIDIMGFVNARGLKINVMPRKLVVPKELVFDSERILKSSLEYDTANNAINALKSTGMFPEGIKVNHYLSDTDAFFIVTNAPDGPTYFERRAVEFAPAENDFDTENAKFKATERYVFGVPDVRGIFGSPGA